MTYVKEEVMAHKTGLEDYYVIKNQKKLHFGYTTGSCAAGAAKGATEMLLGGQKQNETDLMTPKGILLHLELHDVCMEKDTVICAVRKDAGDDPDTTNGILVYARVEKCPKSSEITVDGGKGVGRVTRPGLSQKVGEAAINPVPKAMILKAVEDAADRYHYEGGLKVTISVPEGEQIAKKTFNPRLGIEGGISIIGTSGIVKPFSSEAFVDSIRKSMEVGRATGSPRIVLNSGAKSEKYVRGYYPELPAQAFIHYGNFIGDTIKIAADLEIKAVTLGIMIGKAVKLAEGNLDTHSKQVTMNKDFLREVALSAGCGGETLAVIEKITLARELWTLLSAEDLQAFCSRLLELCHQYCDPLLPEGELTILLISEEGKIIT